MERLNPIVACDWFSFSFRGSYHPYLLPTDFREEICSGTNVFAHRAIYWYRGSKVLTVMGKPKSKALRQDLVLVEVANRWLYDGIEFDNILRTMFPAMVLNNMSRIDICADFAGTDVVMNVVEGLSSGNYYVNGKKLGSVWYEEGKSRLPYCLNFGSVKSEVKWKLYDKTKEIGANTHHCTKPWIVAWWKSNGLDKSNVWRLEVSFHGERFADDARNNIGLYDMQNSDILRVVFAEFYKYRFVVKQRGHTRRVNDKVVPFLRLDECNQPYISRQRQISKGRYDDAQDGKLLLDRLMHSYTESVTLSSETMVEMVPLIKHLCEEYGYYPYLRDRWEWDFECPNPRKVLRG